MRPPPVSDQLYKTPICSQWNPKKQNLSQKYPAARGIFNSLLSVSCNISSMKQLEVRQNTPQRVVFSTLFSVFHVLNISGMKQLEVRQKYPAARGIFNSLLSVSCIKYIKHETTRSSSKIPCCASYFQLSSQCFVRWWNLRLMFDILGETLRRELNYQLSC